MLPIDGINKDSSPLDQSENQYRHAQNMLLTRLGNAVAVEEGFKSMCVLPGKTLLGVVAYKDDEFIAFYSFDALISPLSYIYRIDSKGNATKILESADLKFKPENTIKAVCTYTPKNELLVAWTDNDNPPRIINADNLGFDGLNPTTADIKKLSLYPDIEAPSIYTELEVLTEKTVGGILNGTYTFLFAYEIDDYSTTNYLGSYGAFTVGEGIEYDNESGYGIKFKISGLDTNYDAFKIYAIRSTNGNKTGHYIARKLISTSDSDFTWSGNFSEEVSVDDLVINPASFLTAKTLSVLNNRLHIANLTADSTFDYQPYANSIELEWVKTKFPVYSKNSIEDQGLNKYFMPGATYAFYIAFVLNDGTYSPAFHIPGRSYYTAYDSTPYDKEEGFDHTKGGNNIRNCDFTDYSTLEAINENVFTESIIAYDFELFYEDTANGTIPTGVTIVDSSLGTVGGEIVYLQPALLSTHSVEITINVTGTEDWGFTITDELTNSVITSGTSLSQSSVSQILAPTGDIKYRTEVTTTSGRASFNVEYDISYITPSSGTSRVKYTTPEIPFSMLEVATSSGKMSYTRNENEFYPDNDSWLVKDKDGILTGSLKGEHVKHHKFPFISTAGTAPNLRDTSYDIGYWFRLKNIPLPNLLKGKVKSYTVFYAERNTGDMDVLSYVPMLHPDFFAGGSVESTKDGIRIFDPLLLYKKPQVKNGFLIGEWFKNQPYSYPEGHTALGEVSYLPANTVNTPDFKSNIEQAEHAYFKTFDFDLGNEGGGSGGSSLITNKLIDLSIGNFVIIGSLRQFIPNIYPNFSSLPLVSTSSSHNLSSVVYPSVINKSPTIKGGDITLSEVAFKYMGSYDISTYASEDFSNNITNKYYNPCIYQVLSRIQAEKFGEDLGLKPDLEALDIYGGEYLNQYLLNPSYEMVNTFKPAFPFDSLSTYLDKFPNRIARSVVQQSESSYNIWRRFLSQDYYEMERTRGPITNIEEYNGELIIHTEDSLFKTIGKEALSGGETEIYLGTGDIFNMPPRELIDTVVGYGGTQDMTSCVLTKMGYFFVNEAQGKCFLLSDTLEEISAFGMHNWFRDNIPFTLKDQLSDAGILDRFNDSLFTTLGVGFTAAYDEKYNRIVLSKRAWRLSDDYSWATEQEHTVDAINNKVYMTDFGVYIYKNGELVELTYSSEEVVDESWTYSYAPGIKRWVSEHTYMPNLLWQTKTGLWSVNGKSIYKHNEGDNGQFYNDHLQTKEIHPSYIDIVFNQPGNVVKTFYNINWITESVTLKGRAEFEDTFNDITVFNSYQLSPKVELINLDTVRSAEGIWNFNKFRDMIDLSNQDSEIIDKQNNISYDLLDTTKPWYAQRRFTDKYIIVRLSYDNSKKNTLYLYDISAAFRASFR